MRKLPPSIFIDKSREYELRMAFGGDTFIQTNLTCEGVRTSQEMIQELGEQAARIINLQLLELFADLPVSLEQIDRALENLRPTLYVVPAGWSIEKTEPKSVHEQLEKLKTSPPGQIKVRVETRRQVGPISVAG